MVLNELLKRSKAVGEAISHPVLAMESSALSSTALSALLTDVENMIHAFVSTDDSKIRKDKLELENRLLREKISDHSLTLKSLFEFMLGHIHTDAISNLAHAITKALTYLKNLTATLSSQYVHAHSSISVIIPVRSIVFRRCAESMQIFVTCNIFEEARHRITSSIGILYSRALLKTERSLHMRFRAEDSAALRSLFEMDKTPSTATKLALCHKRGLDINQVNNWFRINRYRKKRENQGLTQRGKDSIFNNIE